MFCRIYLSMKTQNYKFGIRLGTFLLAVMSKAINLSRTVLFVSPCIGMIILKCVSLMLAHEQVTVGGAQIISRVRGARDERLLSTSRGQKTGFYY